MADRVFRLTNGVSFGARYTVVAADATANEITFIFKSADSTSVVPYPIAVSVLVTRAGVNIALGDLVITYPDNGTVLIQDGSTTMLTAGDVISIVAQRADITAE